MKEQIQLTNIKYFRLSTLYGYYTHVCTMCMVICISTENKICLPNMLPGILPIGYVMEGINKIDTKTMSVVI